MIMALVAIWRCDLLLALNPAADTGADVHDLLDAGVEDLPEDLLGLKVQKPSIWACESIAVCQLCLIAYSLVNL